MDSCLARPLNSSSISSNSVVIVNLHFSLLLDGFVDYFVKLVSVFIDLGFSLLSDPI